MVSSYESTTVSTTSTMNNQMIERKPLGLTTGAICDTFWSCMLQDFSEDEDDDTYANLVSVKSGETEKPRQRELVKLGSSIRKASSRAASESKEDGDVVGANDDDDDNDDDASGKGQGTNKKFGNRLRAWKQRWQNARQKKRNKARDEQENAEEEENL